MHEGEEGSVPEGSRSPEAMRFGRRAPTFVRAALWGLKELTHRDGNVIGGSGKRPLLKSLPDFLFCYVVVTLKIEHYTTEMVKTISEIAAF